MKTLDIRLSQSKRDLRKQSETFGDHINDLKVNTLESENSEKADGEFQFFASDDKIKQNKFEKVNVETVLKANRVNISFFARIRSFVNS